MPFDHNPIATAGQHAFGLPAVATERAKARDCWLDELQPGPALQRRFDAAFEEVMFGATVWGLNQDPMRRVVCAISRLARRVDTLDIPGSRWGIDNPDSAYRNNTPQPARQPARLAAAPVAPALSALAAQPMRNTPP